MLDPHSNPWAQQPTATAPPPPPPSGATRDTAIDLDAPAHAGRAPSTAMEEKSQMLLLVFIHGFKGSADTTFEDFPSRLAHLVAETYPGLHVEPIVYPTYDTRGSLAAAVEAFVEWLTEQCVTRESKPDIDPLTGEFKRGSATGGGMGSVKVILAGHSMGGLVAVDAALAIIDSTAKQSATTNPVPSSSSSSQQKQQQPLPALWPRICGVIAYDTPYYGVHPSVFKNGFNKYAGYVNTAQTLGTFFAPMGVGLAASWNNSRNSTAASAGEPSRSASAPAAASGGGAWGSWFGQQQRTDNTERSNSSSSGSGSGSGSSNTATPATTSTTGTGNGWRNALIATGAVALAGGAAASAAYFSKDKIGGAYGWVSDHLLFVSNLWDDRALRKRLDDLVDQPQILFHCYYTRLPASKLPRTAAGGGDGGVVPQRTFVILPPREAKSASLFTPVDNSRATDEVDAHISMFSARANPLYFDLGLRSANLISLCLDNESRYGDQVASQRASSRRRGAEAEAEAKGGEGEGEGEAGLHLGDEGVHGERLV